MRRRLCSSRANALHGGWGTWQRFQQQYACCAEGGWWALSNMGLGCWSCGMLAVAAAACGSAPEARILESMTFPAQK
jgi:hypothetical protein